VINTWSHKFAIGYDSDGYPEGLDKKQRKKHKKKEKKRMKAAKEAAKDASERQVITAPRQAVTQAP